MESESYLVKCEIRALNRIFRKAISQVVILNNRIYSMKERYERARRVNQRSVRYTTRLKLAAIEGSRNMYYQFATIKCEEIESLQDKLRSLSGEEYDFTDESSNFSSEDNEAISC